MGEPELFSLNQPDSFFNINRPGLKDNEMLAQLESIAQGIFSVVATLGRVPVIRAQPGNAAAMVADMIDKMLRQELRGRGNFFAQDLPHNRPVCCCWIDRSTCQSC